MGQYQYSVTQINIKCLHDNLVCKCKGAPFCKFLCWGVVNRDDFPSQITQRCKIRPMINDQKDVHSKRIFKSYDIMRICQGSFFAALVVPLQLLWIPHKYLNIICMLPVSFNCAFESSIIVTSQANILLKALLTLREKMLDKVALLKSVKYKL